MPGPVSSTSNWNTRSFELTGGGVGDLSRTCTRGVALLSSGLILKAVPAGFEFELDGFLEA